MSQDLSGALGSLISSGATSRKDETLPSPVVKSAIPSRTGISKPNSGNGGLGGGIASPLTETNYTSRLFWAEKTITSSDGLLTIKIKPIKSIKFLDANNVELVMNYKEPV